MSEPVAPLARRGDRMLPPLAKRLTRVRLLVWSFDDAAYGSNDGGRGSKPQSRALSRNWELWQAGSYAELDRALDVVGPWWRSVVQREHMDPRHQVRRGKRDRHGRMVGVCDGCPAERGHRRKVVDGSPAGPFHASEWLSLTKLAMLMPEDVFVPAVISEAAGFLPSEALVWSRRTRRAA